ncbi:hypothetical protein [uncultured Nostoc sp.]|uniref:hypothetical protein n=1 Tax=uncultured Nostoc sp. TaxID=340711 RepID=UPI0035C96451
MPVASKPAIAIKAIHQSPPNSLPAFVSESPSKIEKELKEMKTQFMGNSKPQQNKIQLPNPAPQPSSKSKINEELEELKAKYLGKNNS